MGGKVPTPDTPAAAAAQGSAEALSAKCTQLRAEVRMRCVGAAAASATLTPSVLARA